MDTSKSKYESQIKNLRKNYIRFPLDLRPDMLNTFKAVCTANGTNPTAEIKKFISRYCAKYGENVPGAVVKVGVEIPFELEEMAKQRDVNINDVLVDALTTLTEESCE